nr:MAG TPA: hypothetical protein [Caudoviricetes sp.]
MKVVLADQIPLRILFQQPRLLWQNQLRADIKHYSF